MAEVPRPLKMGTGDGQRRSGVPAEVGDHHRGRQDEACLAGREVISLAGWQGCPTGELRASPETQGPSIHAPRCACARGSLRRTLTPLQGHTQGRLCQCILSPPVLLITGGTSAQELR
jgi:hypothetical protein